MSVFACVDKRFNTPWILLAPFQCLYSEGTDFRLGSTQMVHKTATAWRRGGVMGHRKRVKCVAAWQPCCPDSSLNIFQRSQASRHAEVGLYVIVPATLSKRRTLICTNKSGACSSVLWGHQQARQCAYTPGNPPDTYIDERRLSVPSMFLIRVMPTRFCWPLPSSRLVRHSDRFVFLF